MVRKRNLCLLGLLFLICSACSHQQIVEDRIRYTVHTTSDGSDDLLQDHAPVFQADGLSHDYNKIGRPSIRKKGGTEPVIYVDTERPTLYVMKRAFTTNKGDYTNLIYRIHFPKSPFKLIPFNLTAGKNVGLMVVITLDDQKKPMLVTTVHTCGCYLAIIPTTYLPRDFYPKKWQQRPLKVYGETLPAILDYEKIAEPRLLVTLRPVVHRVMDLKLVAEAEFHGKQNNVEYMEFMDMDTLARLPINGETISFYHERGLLRGHVKGAIKAWETLFLSLVSLDLFVGTDKAYADTRETGNPFYTSIKPWNRKKSNMWNFVPFLQFWGWRL
jgi:hypothetical protein